MICCDKCGTKTDERARGKFIFIDRYAATENAYDLCENCAKEVQEAILENRNIEWE